jgi:hypothetical protein
MEKSSARGCGIVLVIVAFIALVIFSIRGCTDEQGARRVLEDNGYKNVTITGFRWWMKGKDDIYSTGFEATAPSGNRVSGAVTRGWFKGSTIRFD